MSLVAVSKTVPAERLVSAVRAGLTSLGENRVQEAEPKVAELPEVAWHLVGPLQANKARRAARIFSVVHSVDSVELARRLDRVAAELLTEASAGHPWGERMPVFLQVNVDRDPRKAGFDPDGLERAVADIVALERLRIDGLMTVGRLVPSPSDARPTFVALRECSERLRSREPRLGAGLSMGMSDDFEVAVEEGATLLRVGRAIFGERPVPRGA